MSCEKRVDLSESNVRSHYLDKLNFTRNLVKDLLPEDKGLKARMESLDLELKELAQRLVGVENESRDLSDINQLVKDGDEILEFIYFATEDEIYLKIKERFNLNPDYSWDLCNKIYNKLQNVSQKIEYLSEINSNDMSEIQKTLMQIAIIFNTNLNTKVEGEQYLIRHLNAIYHYVRGDFNKSLHLKGEMKLNTLQKAKTEYERALEFDKSLTKARKELDKIEKMIV